MAWRLGSAYSQDLRDRVLAAVDRGAAVRIVAPLMQVSISYIYKALERRDATGETAARPGRGLRARKLAPHESALQAEIRARPDATLAELRRWLFETRGVSVSTGCLVEHPRPARPDAQKKSQHAAEQDRADVAAARQAWCAAQPGLNPAKLVFIDESGFATDMARRHGRCRRGRRLVAAAPHGHWKTSTLIAALRHDGIVAPVVIDHPMNGATSA